MPGGIAYKLDPSTVDAVVGQLTQLTQKIEDDLRSLETQVESHLSTWTGDAQASYWTQKADWDGHAATLHQNLGEATTALYRILAEYEATRDQNQRMWNGFSGVG